MLIDSNVKPEQTLTTVGNIVTHQQTDFRGLLMTMKIGDYDSANRMATISNVSFGVGLLGIGLGVYGLVSSDSGTSSEVIKQS